MIPMMQCTRKFCSFVARFWPSMLVLSIILYGTLSSHPLGDEKLPAIPHIDKLIHFLMMGGLVAAILFDLRRHVFRSAEDTFRLRLSPYIILCVALGVIAFSIFDEWLQGQLSIGRPSEIYDGIANIMGIIVASVSAPAVLKRMFPDPR